VAINGTQRRSPGLGGCTHLMRDAISGHQRHSEALAALGRVHAPEEGCNQWPSTALRGARRAWEGART
jgi:hypothetical protein